MQMDRRIVLKKADEKTDVYLSRFYYTEMNTAAMAGQLILSYRKQGSEEALSAVPEGAYGIYSVTADAKNWSDPEQFKSPSEPPQLWYPAPLSSDRLTIANPVMEIRFSCGVSGYNGTRGNKIVVVIPSFTYTNPLSVGAAGAPSGYQGTYADT